jgi:hypothetical protein
MSHAARQVRSIQTKGADSGGASSAQEQGACAWKSAQVFIPARRY